MTAITRLIRTEPAVLTGIIVAALFLCGVNLSDAQVSAATQVLAGVLPIIAGSVVVRQNVTPAAHAYQDANAPHGENPELIDDEDVR